MGLSLSVSRIVRDFLFVCALAGLVNIFQGSVLNMNLMEPIYKALKEHYSGHICLGLTLFIGGATLVFSQYCTLHLAWLDRYARKILKPSAQIAAGMCVTAGNLLTTRPPG